MPAAMNRSILFMLTSAYSTFGVVGFLIVRGIRKNAAYLAALPPADDAPHQA